MTGVFGEGGSEVHLPIFENRRKPTRRTLSRLAAEHASPDPGDWLSLDRVYSGPNESFPSASPPVVQLKTVVVNPMLPSDRRRYQVYRQMNPPFFQEFLSACLYQPSIDQCHGPWPLRVGKTVFEAGTRFAPEPSIDLDRLR